MTGQLAGELPALAKAMVAFAWGWMATGIFIGLLFGLYSFEGPLPEPKSIGEYASWGYFDPDGYQSPPVNWGINTDRKKSFFAKLKEITQE